MLQHCCLLHSDFNNDSSHNLSVENGIDISTVDFFECCFFNNSIQFVFDAPLVHEFLPKHFSYFIRCVGAADTKKVYTVQYKRIYCCVQLG